MQNNCSRNDVSYAGFWARFFAYVVDSIIVFFALLIVRLVMAGVMAAAEETPLAGNILFQYNLVDIVLYLAQIVYFVLFTYCTGTTPGKRLMNLRVISTDCSKLTFINVLYREVIGRFLCSVFLGIGYIVAGIDKQKRGVHDMLCDTRVIYAKKVKVYPVYPAQNVQTAPGGDSVVPPAQTVLHEQESSSVVPPVQKMPPQTGSYRMVQPQSAPPRNMPVQPPGEPLQDVQEESQQEKDTHTKDL